VTAIASSSSRRLSPAALATLGALLLLLAWDASGLDLALAGLAAGPAGFPLREHWLLFNVLHEGARRLAWLLALALCLGVWWPWGPLRRLQRWQRLRLAVATLLAVLAVSLLKTLSVTSCPWDLQAFGGVARHVSHWSLRPDGGAGRCFPAGHASAGFSFIGGYFSLRDQHAVLARRWLAAAIGAGLVLGIAQQLRGAHFMSHTLWTGLVCWAAAWATHRFWPCGAREC
jgi:membrane-associated PAP2 superfamily phosphatase